MDKLSYTNAGLFPWKILKHLDLLEELSERQNIFPIHAQMLPTNRCNRNCPMCSCAARNKGLEMSLEDAVTIIGQLASLGCKAVTITGGGEPLAHPAIREIVLCFVEYGIKVGLTTNGLLLSEMPVETLRNITWARISNDDSREFNADYVADLSEAMLKAPNVDWAFSHVANKEPNFEEIQRIVEFANEHDFTHVRIVPDLFIVEDVNLQEVRGFLRGKGVPDNLVIYQHRKDFVRGGDCRMGYLKPLIGPDCKIYACCGVQYALDPPTYDLPEELCIGDALKLTELYEGGMTPLDGSICKRCYYDASNKALDNLLRPLDHQEFV